MKFRRDERKWICDHFRPLVNDIQSKLGKHDEEAFQDTEKLEAGTPGQDVVLLVLRLVQQSENPMCKHSTE